VLGLGRESAEETCMQIYGKGAQSSHSHGPAHTSAREWSSGEAQADVAHWVQWLVDERALPQCESLPANALWDDDTPAASIALSFPLFAHLSPFVEMSVVEAHGTRLHNLAGTNRARCRQAIVSSPEFTFTHANFEIESIYLWR
jgi:hypothetical protein